MFLIKWLLAWQSELCHSRFTIMNEELRVTYRNCLYKVTLFFNHLILKVLFVPHQIISRARHHSLSEHEGQNDFRAFIVSSLNSRKREIESAHGDLGKIADIFADILDKAWKLYGKNFFKLRLL